MYLARYWAHPRCPALPAHIRASSGHTIQHKNKFLKISLSLYNPFPAPIAASRLSRRVALHEFCNGHRVVIQVVSEVGGDLPRARLRDLFAVGSQRRREQREHRNTKPSSVSEYS